MRIERTGASWTCEAETQAVHYRVQVAGTSPTRIEIIDATVVQIQGPPDDERVVSFFKKIAAINYKSNSAPAATAWISASAIENRAQATFGEAKFTLSGDKPARSLSIKALNSRY